MVDFKKLDEMDVLISSRPMTEEERKAFSEFLRKKKEKRKRAGSYSNLDDLEKRLTAVREPKATYSTRRLSQASAGKSKSKGTRKRAK